MCTVSQRAKNYFQLILSNKHGNASCSKRDFFINSVHIRADSWKICHFWDLIDAIFICFSERSQQNRRTKAEQKLNGLVMKNDISLLLCFYCGWIWNFHVEYGAYELVRFTRSSFIQFHNSHLRWRRRENFLLEATITYG